MRMYKIQAEKGGTSYIENSWGTLEVMMKSLDIGTPIIITPVEMTKEEVDALPEFMGF